MKVGRGLVVVETFFISTSPSPRVCNGKSHEVQGRRLVGEER
jgi:hypothetical protein